MKSVLIVDDHPVLATAVANALIHQDIASVTTFTPEDADLEAKAVAANPDLCLLDLDLGHRQAVGMRLAKVALAAGLEVAMFTGSTDEIALGKCIEAGAIGVIRKQRSFSEVVDSICGLLEGTPCNSDSELLRWVLAAQRHTTERKRALGPFARLSGREEQVLRHLMDGLVVDQIASADFVSQATVRSQVRAVLQKLGVRSQLAAVAVAHRTGWSMSQLAETEHSAR